MYSLFDTHVHLIELFENTGETKISFIQSLQKAEVKKILVMSIGEKQWIQTDQFIQKGLFYFALGLHPFYIREHKEDHLIKLRESLQNREEKQIIAVGEIGLDRYLSELIEKKSWERQCYFFEKQLYLAQEFELPVCIHARKSYDQVFSFLKKIVLASTGVIHGFSGSYEQAKKFIDLGYKIGVGGVITYERASKSRDVMKKLPLESLLLETDSPDMPICGFQGQANHPIRLVHILKSLSEIRKESSQSIAEILWKNSLNLFNLKAT